MRPPLVWLDVVDTSYSPAAPPVSYDAVAATTARRGESPLACLRAAHNAAKAALCAAAAAAAAAPGGSSGRLGVLDLACGRGGDAGKWANTAAAAGVALSYTGVDSSGASLDIARSRWRTDGTGSPAWVLADLSSSSGLPGVADASVDVVACMFAMHYFWRDAASARAIWATIGRVLRPGGIAALVLPSAEDIVTRARRGGRLQVCALERPHARTHARTRVYAQGAHYAVRALPSEDRLALSRHAPYGLGYEFYLRDAVMSGAPGHGLREYLVSWPSLVATAAAAGDCHPLGATRRRYASSIARDLRGEEADISGLYVEVLFRRGAEPGRA